MIATLTLALVPALALNGPQPLDPADATQPRPIAEANAEPDTQSPRADERTTAPAPDRRSTSSLSTVPLSALQCGAGCGLALAAVPLALLCPTTVCLGGPFLLGYFETWIGDRLGADRAPAVAPIATAYVGVAASVVAGVSVYGLAIVGGAPSDVAAPAALFSSGGLFLLTLGAVPIAYAIAATPKHALDDGTEPPDFMEPRVPLDVRKRRR